MVEIYKKILIILGGNLSLSFIFSLKKLMIMLQDIQKKQGNKGLVLYLKAASVVLQQAASGHRHPNLTDLGPRISRTKGQGLPRIIPAKFRIIIHNRAPGYTR